MLKNQTIVDMNRSCTMSAPSNYFSPLSTDTDLPDCRALSYQNSIWKSICTSKRYPEKSMVPTECDGCTHHLLGLKYFKKNITDKLQKLIFFKRQARIISEEILETLHNCKDEQEFNSELEKVRDKWMEIEVRYTRNEPPDQFPQYFELYKANSTKFKTTRYAHKKAELAYN